MMLELLGGIGLFLIGMHLLSEGLKSLAGSSMRQIMARLVRGPLSGILVGTGLTAVIQSSSATTVLAIGFVSAGMLSFPAALSVILGANVGSTVTAWVVSLLGFKFSIAAVAYPLLGFAAIIQTLGRGRLRHSAMAAVGFALIFVAIDLMQTGMANAAENFDPAAFPRADSIIGLSLLVGIGAIMTVLMQSSSAAVVVTLAALHSGTLNLDQAAAMAIGQNLGTTVKAALAAFAGPLAAKRTALGHILFNFSVGLLALLLFRQFVDSILFLSKLMHIDELSMVLSLFHTAFNLLGVIIFYPFLGRFSAMINRLLPEKSNQLTRHLDEAAINTPDAAISNAARTLREAGAYTLLRLVHLIESEKLPVSGRPKSVVSAVATTNHYLTRVDSHSSEVRRRYIDVMHAIDHLNSLTELCDELEKIATIRSNPELYRHGELMARRLSEVCEWLAHIEPHDRDTLDERVSKLAEFSRELANSRRVGRVEVLEKTATGNLAPEDAMRQIESIRWLDRAAFHVWRMTEHLAEV